MTQLIQLQAVPNQSFSAAFNDRRYELTIKNTAGVMSLDLVRDNVTIYQGARIVAGTPLIPYAYQESGNFIITTENGEIPFYTRFGVTQFLFYASPAEIEVING